MTRTSYTEAREKLASFWDETISSREPMVMDRRGHESVVMMPLDEWRSMEATAHLLRSPANAQRLLGALQRLESGQGKAMTPPELTSLAEK
ncbi:type II toxin-antitoxin system Phd/YefM family antitoxin [Synoicihabitans lomoniglobus]|uniref:type II toxin-antitoxin system Phd/YefM family antitoxin n=1 Tax=Synoicihabitans lomoniglobus TaxID=2909285 RepID=UPI0031F2EA19